MKITSKLKVILFALYLVLTSCSSGSNSTNTTPGKIPARATFAITPTFVLYGFDQRANVYYLRLNLLSRKLRGNGQSWVNIGSYSLSNINIGCVNENTEEVICVTISPKLLETLEMNAPITVALGSVSAGTLLYFGNFDKINFQPTEQIRPLRKDGFKIWEKTLQGVMGEPGFAPTFVPNWNENIQKFQELKNNFSETLDDKFWVGDSNLTLEMSDRFFETDLEIARFVSESPMFIKYFNTSFYGPIYGSVRGLANKLIKDAQDAGHSGSGDVIEATKLIAEGDNSKTLFDAMQRYVDAWRKVSRYSRP